jgi:hypothetical protein
LTFVYKLLTIKIFLSALALSEAAFDYFSSSLSLFLVFVLASAAASSKIYKYECEMLLALLALSQGIRSIFILNQMYQSAARFKVKCSGYVIILFQKAERLQFTRQTLQLRQPITYFFFILLVLLPFAVPLEQRGNAEDAKSLPKQTYSIFSIFYDRPKQ